MHSDWHAVARTIEDRMDQLGLSQTDLVRRSGVSDATIRKLQRGDATGEFRRPVLAAVSRALEMHPGALSAIARGDEPPRVRDFLDRRLLMEKLRAVREALNDLEDVIARAQPGS